MKLPNFQFIIKLLFRADLLIHIAKNYFCDHCNTCLLKWFGFAHNKDKK